jgi:hypothetical protein
VTSKGERDDIIPLSRFRASLARPRGMRRVEALLEAPDPAAAVAALSMPEIYFLIKEVGMGDGAELVALATPEQLRGCLDMEIWDRDRVQLEAATPWLEAILEVGFEKVGQVWQRLDPELRALFLARNTRIIDHSLEEEVPDDEERPMFTTPDTFFTVVLTSEREDDIRLVHQIIDDLYRADMQLARHTILSARSEMQSELEEMSYRWRAGRMADLGYVDFYEALEVFRPIDPDTIRIGEVRTDELAERSGEPTGAGLPAPVLEPMAGTFLARALEQVTDAGEAERLEVALLYLVNRVLSASRVAPGDEHAVRTASQQAGATVSLGLEHLCGARLERAPAALRSVSLTRLHRLGHSLTLRLSRMARLLAPRAVTAGEPSHSVLESLLRARPLFSESLEDPPRGGARAFASLRDLRAAAEHMTELAARIALADALGVDLLAIAQVPEPRPELDDHARTAVARLVAGGELDAAPLGPSELDRLLRIMGPDRRIGDEARAAAQRAVAELAGQHRIAVPPAILAHLVDGWLERLDDELGGLSAGQPIDAASVGGVITSAQKT